MSLVVIGVGLEFLNEERIKKPKSLSVRCSKQTLWEFLSFRKTTQTLGENGLLV